MQNGSHKEADELLEEKNELLKENIGDVSLENLNALYRKLIRIKHRAFHHYLNATVTESKKTLEQILLIRDDEEKKRLIADIKIASQNLREISTTDIMPPGEKAYELIMESLRLIGGIEEILNYAHIDAEQRRQLIDEFFKFEKYTERVDNYVSKFSDTDKKKENNLKDKKDITP
ncbi:MAG: hypothetical protein LBJ80_00170 [Rickettsiales bacterium]|jgi:hypothetical protein|nr:hypothetical protein [Rickettsiales bacterium]